MATFTMVLKDVVDATHGDIGLGEYPIFDAAYREPLNKKILDHFWNQEIGLETIDMFTFAMRRKMNEIMPLYNKLYQSELLAVDPLLTFRSTTQSAMTGTASSDVSMSSTGTTQGTSTEDGEVTGQGESTGTTGQTTDGRTRVVGSDLPQTRLSPDEDYATSAVDTTSLSSGDGNSHELNNTTQNTLNNASSEAESSESGTTTQTSEQTADSDVTSSGFSGSMSSLLMEYRETFLNIDMLIIGELAELFMLVWSNGDSFTYGYGY